MAKETKSLTIHPDDENNAIYTYQCFGWEVLSSQDVHTKDSHVEYGWSITETTHYTKLLFQRDPANVPNYTQVRALEQKFNSIPGPGERPNKKYSGLVIFLGLLVYIIPGIYMIMKNKAADAELARWEQRCREYEQARQIILEEARALSAS